MSATAEAPSPAVREALRSLLGASTAFNALEPGTRREIANALVRISDTAVGLARMAGEEEDAAGPPPSRRPALAAAQNAGSEFSGTAVDRLAGTTQRVLQAISFPRFVNELITGVFKAIVDSNQQQLQSFIELIRNVAASTEDFAGANVGTAGARQWLAERFGANFEVRGADTDTTEAELRAMSPEDRAEWQQEQARSTRLVLRPGAEMPPSAALRGALGLRPDEQLPSGGNPENLVAFAQTQLARNRQQMLSTMVMMGLQRIVVESGRINASMRFHIDARSAAAEDRGSSFDFRNEVAASGSFGFGPWGASASVKNTIGYVTTNNVSTSEELNASADLNSSVELIFRSDYVPLTRLAGVEEVERIRVNTVNPTEEARLAEETARQRTSAQRSDDSSRRDAVTQRLSQRPALPQAPPLTQPGGSGGSGAGAQRGGGGTAGTGGGTAGTGGGTAGTGGSTPTRTTTGTGGGTAGTSGTTPARTTTGTGGGTAGTGGGTTGAGGSTPTRTTTGTAGRSQALGAVRR